MRNKKKTALVLFSILIGTFLTVIGLYIGLRNIILTKAITKVQQKINSEYNLKLNIGSQEFIAFATISLNNITVIPNNGDTLLHLNNLIAAPNLFEWIKGKKSFNRFEIDGGSLTLVKKNNLSNYNFLFEKKLEKNEISTKTKNYEDIANNLLEKISEAIPQKINVQNFKASLNTDNNIEKFVFNSFTKSNNKIKAQLVSRNQQLNLNGNLNEDLSKGDIKIYSDKVFKLPFIDSLTGASVSLKNMHFNFEKSGATGFEYRGIAEAGDLYLYHSKLSDDSVYIQSSSVLFNARIKNNFIELDSSSYVRINKVTANVYAAYDKNKGKTISLSCKIDPVNANSFFTSLPPGLFNSVRTIEADGMLSYKMNLKVSLDLPDSVKFNSALTGINLKIKSYGIAGIDKLNSSFTYTAYEKGQAVKSFVVGPENPDFVPLGGISNYIQKAILTSEDGAFFWHKGFNEEAIAQSIAINLKEGKFKRGGSTISMQLVKNVFLTRKKTLSRKLEEILITWIIENQRTASKERMFEVYLNVIEYGPMLYGIGPACMFYFGKKPSDITLSEAIFISSLLPHPKWFKYSFDKEGNIKAYLADYFRFIGKVMFGRKLISENEYNDLKPQVELYRDAKKLLNPEIDINPDSLDLMPNE